jgi:hypothetical protein
VPRWPRPLPQAVVQVTGPALDLVLERGEQTRHKDGAPSKRGMGEQQSWLTLLDSIPAASFLQIEGGEYLLLRRYFLR